MESTCESIEYGWNCFLGIGGIPDINGCNQTGFDGNGVFDIGEGIWNFPYHLNFSDNNIIINGQGALQSILNYTGTESIWIQCATHSCWISLQNLSIASNDYNRSYYQFYLENGGTIYVQNVVFDGENYGNNNGEPFWKVINEGTVIFKDCHFRNNNVIYQFLNGIRGYFINCFFEYNDLINMHYNNNYINTMFHISGYLVIQHCIFQNNTQENKYLFMIDDGGTLELINTTFYRNQGKGQRNTALIHVQDSNLRVTNCLFTQNIGYKEIIIVNQSDIFIDSSIFDTNMDIYYDPILYLLIFSSFYHLLKYQLNLIVILDDNPYWIHVIIFHP